MGLGAYCEVLTANGAGKRAENITPDDIVFEAMTGAAVSVKKVYNGPAVGMHRIAADNGAVVDLTEDHAVLTVAGLVEAGRVRVGDMLQTGSGPVRCGESQGLLGDYNVYDISVQTGSEISPCLSVNGLVVAALKAR